MQFVNGITMISEIVSELYSSVLVVYFQLLSSGLGLLHQCLCSVLDIECKYFSDHNEKDLHSAFLLKYSLLFQT